MNPCKYLLPALCLPALSLLAALPIRADIKTTHETTMGGKPLSKTTRYVRAGAERSETTFMFGGTEQKSITITLCDKNQMLTLSPDLKLYTVTPLIEADAPAKAPAAGAKKTGAMTMTLVSLKDLGEEKIGEYSTRRYEVTTRMQSSGCLGDSDTTTRQILYVAPAEGDGTGASAGCNLTSSSDDNDNNCQTSMSRKGDWAAYDRLLKGLQVRSHMFADATSNEAQSETTLTMVSRAKLGDEWFTIPEGFKQVTAAEMQAAQSKAMLEKMMAAGNEDAEDEQEEMDEEPGDEQDEE